MRRASVADAQDIRRPKGGTKDLWGSVEVPSYEGSATHRHRVVSKRDEALKKFLCGARVMTPIACLAVSHLV